ncbi:MAG: hypothetical protein JXQ87_06645 [Bacteroidia bacterium]
MENKSGIKELQEKFEKGMELTFKRLIEFKKSKNTPFIFSKNGEIYYQSAEEVERSLDSK